MQKLIIRWLINAVALWVAITFVPGIHAQGEWGALLVLAVIFGLVNALLRPLLNVLTCPLIILTLGLGTLLINTLLFWLSGWVGAQFGVGFTVEGFWPAFFGSLIVTLVSLILTLLVKDELEGKRRQERKWA
jgi:putative membrane protein